MNLLNFSQSFPDDESCIEHFKAQRDQIGVACPKCGSTEHIWLRNKLRYECNALPLSPVASKRYGVGVYKITVSLLVCCHAPIDLYKKVIFSFRTATTTGT